MIHFPNLKKRFSALFARKGSAVALTELSAHERTELERKTSEERAELLADLGHKATAPVAKPAASAAPTTPALVSSVATTTPAAVTTPPLSVAPEPAKGESVAPAVAPPLATASTPPPLTGRARCIAALEKAPEREAARLVAEAKQKEASKTARTLLDTRTLEFSKLSTHDSRASFWRLHKDELNAAADTCHGSVKAFLRWR